MKRQLCERLLFANSSEDVTDALQDLEVSWFPLGNNENNFGVIENQQASPFAALIEKLTNSIDAILMRRSLEEGISPKSSQSPDSMHSAIERFFPKDHKNWHLKGVKSFGLYIGSHLPRAVFRES